MGSVERYTNNLIRMKETAASEAEDPYMMSPTKGDSSVFEVKGVSDRYVQGKNPNLISSFKYVTSSSLPGEKVMKLRAQLLQNQAGKSVNGRALATPLKPVTNIIQRSVTASVTREDSI